MLIQCAACKEYFELQEGRGENAGEGEQLCADCLIAHIEKLLYGWSSRQAQAEEAGKHRREAA